MSETVTLELDCVVDDLSPIQLEQYEKAEKEHDEIRSKLNVGKHCVCASETTTQC